MSGKVSKDQKGVQKEEKSKLRKEHAEWAEYTVQADNRLAIPVALKNELLSKDFAYKFISAVNLAKNHGHKDGGWKPYKPDYKESSGAFSGASDGFFRRGDLVLAVRPGWLQDQEKSKLVAKNKLMANRHDKKAAEELRKILGSAPGVSIMDGDDV